MEGLSSISTLIAMSAGYVTSFIIRCKNPTVNLAPPIQRIFSVARSTSAMIPTDCDKNDNVRVLFCVTDMRSRGACMPVIYHIDGQPALTR